MYMGIIVTCAGTNSVARIARYMPSLPLKSTLANEKLASVPITTSPSTVKNETIKLLPNSFKILNWLIMVAKFCHWSCSFGRPKGFT